MDAQLEQRIKRLEQQVRMLRTTEPTRYVHAEYNSNTANSMTDADYTLVDYENKVVDTHDAVTVGAAWKFTAPLPGPYIASACAKLANNAGWIINEQVLIYVYKNGSVYRLLNNKTAFDNGGGANVNICVSGTLSLYLNTYDYINFYVYQNSGGAINLNGTATQNWCSITRVG